MGLNFDCALLTAADIHATDERAAQLGIPPQELMLRAGTALTQEILKRYAPSKVLIICGPGNNGGDGFVVARLLTEHHWSVTVSTENAALPHNEPARTHAHYYSKECIPFTAINSDFIQQFDLVIDAGFGVGLSRQLNEQWESLLQCLQNSKKPIIAIDIPTGIGDFGQLFSQYPIQADLTLALFKKKPAHIIAPGRKYCAEVIVCDIGFDAKQVPIEPRFYENTPKLWAQQWQQLQPQWHTHKYQRGHLVVFGGPELPGAPCLSALGAAVCGTGLVTILCDPDSWSIYAAQMRSIMVRSIRGQDDFLAYVHNKNINAIVIGPGAIGCIELPDYIDAVLASKKPCVLDAEALNVIASDPERFFPLLHNNCVLTPHEGEFKRLFPHSPQLKGIERLQAVQLASQETGVVVVLKGAETLVGLSDGRLIINNHASPYLATAGSGDVLAGAIAAFLAQGIKAPLAAAMGIWLHGHAGKIAGIGLIADNLPQWLICAQQELIELYQDKERSSNVFS